MEQVLPENFDIALAVGKFNEQIIKHEFLYHDIPIRPTEGKHPFDFYLPDNRSVEVKADLRSQATNYAILEEPSFTRAADIHIHTLTYAIVLTRKQVEELYQRGKVVRVGDYQYQGRAVSKTEVKNTGIYLDRFINQLTTN